MIYNIKTIKWGLVDTNEYINFYYKKKQEDNLTLVHGIRESTTIENISVEREKPAV